MIEAVVLDVGETLISDTRYWLSWARWLDVPWHTVSALVGAVTAQGRDSADALRLIRPGLDVERELAEREAAGAGQVMDESDLYPDARPALAALRRAGLRVCLAGNQTVRAGELLRELRLPVDAVATSAEWGAAKPSAEFFARVVELGGTAPGRTVYVGDHPAYDAIPAKRAGLRTAHIRRGPWGPLWADDPATIASADWRIDSLLDLVPLVTG